jgi:hypothetical protein
MRQRLIQSTRQVDKNFSDSRIKSRCYLKKGSSTDVEIQIGVAGCFRVLGSGIFLSKLGRRQHLLKINRIGLHFHRYQIEAGLDSKQCCVSNKDIQSKQSLLVFHVSKSKQLRVHACAHIQANLQS